MMIETGRERHFPDYVFGRHVFHKFGNGCGGGGDGDDDGIPVGSGELAKFRRLYDLLSHRNAGMVIERL